MASRPGNVPAGNRSKVATMKTTRTKIKTVLKEEEDSIPAVRNEDFIKDEDVNLAPTEASIENMRTKLRGFAFKSATDVNTSSRSRRNASAVTSASALVKTEDVSGTGNGTNNSNGIGKSCVI